MPVKISKKGPSISETVVAAFEHRIGTRLPDDYRKFLLTNNGGKPETNTFAIAQIGTGGVNLFLQLGGVGDADLDAERLRMEGRVPSSVLPIAEAEGGNRICLSLKKDDFGNVYFWDHEQEAEEGEEPSYQNLYKVSDTFDGFWHSLQLFDPNTIELKEGQVEEVWVNPEFLKKLKGNK